MIVAALVLGIGAVRSTRYMIGSMRSSEQRRACVSREELVREISALKVAPQGVLASNAQGLTWYALRRPVRLRTASRDGIAGDVLIWIDPARACEFAIDAEGVARPPCSASTLGANVVVCRDAATR